MVGSADDVARTAAALENVMCSSLGEEHVVAKGEDGASWTHFIIGKEPERVEAMMSGIHERFVDMCRRSGEPMIPALRWETRYSRVAGECVPEAEILNI